MRDLSIFFYGRPLPLDDEEAIDNVVAYLHAHKRLLALSRLMPEPSTAVEVRTPSLTQPDLDANNARKLASEPKAATTLAENEENEEETHEEETDDEEAFNAAQTLESTRLIDWFERAWVALNQPKDGATGDQFFNAMTNLGFQPTAEHPKEAIKTAIRVNPRFRKVGVTSNNAALWRLKPKTPVVQSSLARLSTTDDKTLGYEEPSLNHRPPVGQRVIDYAIKAWQSLGEGVTIEQLAAKMVELGWTTASDPARILRATLQKPRYNSTFIRDDGLWYRNDDNLILVPDESQEPDEDVDLALEQKVSANRAASQIVRLF